MATPCPMFVGGKEVPSFSSETTPVYNPSHGTVIAQAPVGNAADVHNAVKVATAALSGWSETPAAERARILFRYKHLLEENFEALARLVTEEHGKTIDESRGDVRRGIEVVEFACGVPILLNGQFHDNVARNIDGVVMRQPVGVCAGITPFNFPAMVPMWMYPLAIACGNTFILKPSPKVPLTALRLARLALEAGLPAGVLNVIHGGKEVVDAILAHPDVAAVSFVGSTKVAKYIYETGTANGKRVQAAGGAKNFMIVMPDAEMEFTTGAVIGAAFGCSGQRCMAGSVAIAVDRVADAFLEQLTKSTLAMKVGATDKDDSIGMGPVIDQTSRDRITKYLDIGTQEGATLVADGRKTATSNGGFFVGPSIFDHVKPEMRIAKEEIFGPVLSVMRAPTLDDAIAMANQSAYGNGAVLFTNDGGAARKFAREVKCGMLGINVGVPAPMSIFPFSGWNDSFFGDLHIQGLEGIQFYTQSKVVLSRWNTGGRRGTWS
jgi:malonate-semialdehyde dehydrogenase (acetylating)/methylmalonate-semialdehyde dehydrogenase